MRIFLAVILLISAHSAGLAQPQACTVQLTVVLSDLASWSWRKEGPDLTVATLKHGVVIPGAAGVPDLTAGAFSAHDRRGPIRVRSIRSDHGPRRIIFVVETGKRMPPPARKIQAAVISGILSEARPGDSFALITAGGPPTELPFGSSREAILATAAQLVDPPQGKAKGLRPLDAVLEATRWLQPPQAGDAIFALVFSLEGRHRASFSEVRDALAAGGIRFFGVELGHVTQPNPESLDSASLMGGYLNISHAPVGNVDHLIQLCRDSGGIFAWENTAGGRRYDLTQGRLEGLVAAAKCMYRAATAYYVLELDSAGRDLVVGFAPGIEEKYPGALEPYYSHSLPPCSSR